MVSIIVLSWNARQEVLACLNSVRAACAGLAHEIIVIDNASSDDSVDYLKKLSGMRLLENSTNVGYAAGNNQGYALAKGDYILLLNQDTVVNTAAIQAMVQWLDARPTYGAVTVRLLNADGSTQYYMHRRFPRWYVLPLAFIHKRYRWFRPNLVRQYLYLDNPFTEDFDIDQAAGACLLLRRTALDQLGYLFNAERFPLYYNDVDLCRRLWQRHWKIRCLTGVSIIHHKGTSVKKLPRWHNAWVYLHAAWHYFTSSGRK